MAASLISFGADGEIELSTPKGIQAVVRFPTEAEQAKGINTVPRATRVKEKVALDKQRRSS